MADLGSLHISSTFDGSAVIEGLKKQADAIRNGVDEAMKAQDLQSTSAQEHIRRQREAIEALEREYNILGKQIGGAFKPGMAGEAQALEQMKSLKQTIDAQKEALSKLEASAVKTDSAHASLRSRIRTLREEMAILVDQGIDEESEAYKRLANELGRLQDIQLDIAQQGRVLSNDEAQFQGLLAGLQGVSGGFGAVTGAMALFGEESEEVQKSMQKMMATMQVVQGIQSVSQALNKDSAFRLVTLVKVKEWWAGVTGRVAIALRAQNVAHLQAVSASATDTSATTANTTATSALAVAKAKLVAVMRVLWSTMVSNPVTAVIAGIAALGMAIYKMTEKSRDAAKAQRELNEKIIAASAEPVGALMALQARYNALGNDLKAKEKFVRDNAEEFKKLGISVHNVVDADRAFVQNTEAFKGALIDRAKALAMAELAQEKFKEAAKARYSAEQMRDTTTMVIGGASGGVGSAGGATIATKNTAKERAMANADALERQAIDMMTGSVNLQQVYNDKVDKLNAEADKNHRKTIGGRAEQLKKLIADKEQELLALDVDDKAGRSRLQAQKKRLEAELSKIEPAQSHGATSSKDPYTDLLDKRKAHYQTLYKIINAGDEEAMARAKAHFSALLQQGDTYLDYLKRQRAEVAKAGGAGAQKKLGILDAKIAEETQRTVTEEFAKRIDLAISSADTALDKLLLIQEAQKALGDSDTSPMLQVEMQEMLATREAAALEEINQAHRDAVKAYEEHLRSKLTATERYIEEKQALETLEAQASTPEARGAIRKQIETLDMNHTIDVAKNYEALLQEHGTFRQRMQAIDDDYRSKAALAREQGDLELAASIEQAGEQAMQALAMQELQENPIYSKLFGGLEEMATTELERLIDLFEGSKLELKAKLSTEDFAKVEQSVGRIKNEIAQNNPFKGLVRAVKDYGKATSDEERKNSAKRIASSASSAVGMLGQGFGQVTGAMQQMGVKMDEETAGILGSIGGIMDGASEMASGIASGNPMAMISGGLKVLTGAFELFNSKDRKANKQIREHQERVKSLQETYQELERAVDKALGMEQFKTASAQMRNLEEQQRRLNEMARLERSKKKADEGKAQEYADQAKEAMRKREELIDQMREDILGSGVRDLAQDLGDAFVEAFEKGESAVGAFGKKVDQVVAAIMRKMILKNLVEAPIGNIIQGYTERWVGSNGGLAMSVDAINKSAVAMGQELKQKLEQISPALQSALSSIPAIANAGDGTGLSGEIKGVTERTASALEGQINAMRITVEQAKSLHEGTNALINQSLVYLANIERHTSRLEAIERGIVSIDRKTQAQSSTPPLAGLSETLRSAGGG